MSLNFSIFVNLSSVIQQGLTSSQSHNSVVNTCYLGGSILQMQRKKALSIDTAALHFCILKEDFMILQSGV